MPSSADPENAAAANSAAGTQGGTRAPTPKCSAPRQSQKAKLAHAAATRSYPRAPIAPAKDTASGSAQRTPRARSQTARSQQACYSTARQEFPSGSAAPPGPASA